MYCLSRQAIVKISILAELLKKPLSQKQQNATLANPKPLPRLHSLFSLSLVHIHSNIFAMFLQVKQPFCTNTNTRALLQTKFYLG